MTIAVQLNLANGSHIARSHTFREFAIRHLLIALQPRHVEAPQPAGMESNHLGYDSTAQSRQHSVAATRYPLSFIPQASLPNTIQLSIISSLILVVKPDFRLRNLWCDHEFNLCHPLFKFQSFFLKSLSYGDDPIHGSAGWVSWPARDWREATTPPSLWNGPEWVCDQCAALICAGYCPADEINAARVWVWRVAGL